MNTFDKLLRLYRKTTKKSLRTFWWRYDYPSKLNFGDELTPLLVEKLYGIECKWAGPTQCEFAGVGSIVEILQKPNVKQDVNLWGSGFIKDGEINANTNLHFYSVRGEKSERRVPEENISLGDPGLLVSMVFKPSMAKRQKIGLVPHYVDLDSPTITEMASRDDVKIINVFDTVEQVINDITSCEIVFSSSLHGLVMADAFSIPNYWTPFSTQLTGGDYKFNDYYSVFGRTANPIDHTQLASLDYDQLIDSYAPINNLKSIQKNIFNSFPYK